MKEDYIIWKVFGTYTTFLYSNEGRERGGIHVYGGNKWRIGGGGEASRWMSVGEETMSLKIELCKPQGSRYITDIVLVWPTGLYHRNSAAHFKEIETEES